jgi:hypothetical protein
MIAVTVLFSVWGMLDLVTTNTHFETELQQMNATLQLMNAFLSLAACNNTQ